MRNREKMIKNPEKPDKVEKGEQVNFDNLEGEELYDAALKETSKFQRLMDQIKQKQWYKDGKSAHREMMHAFKTILKKTGDTVIMLGGTAVSLGSLGISGLVSYDVIPQVMEKGAGDPVSASVVLVSGLITLIGGTSAFKAAERLFNKEK